MPASRPDFSREAAAFTTGHTCVAGVDEAGRGPLAGPVTAAAVRLNPSRIPLGLNDSKQLSPARRASLAAQLMEWAEKRDRSAAF